MSELGRGYSEVRIDKVDPHSYCGSSCFTSPGPEWELLTVCPMESIASVQENGQDPDCKYWNSNKVIKVQTLAIVWCKREKQNEEVPQMPE